MNAKQEVKVIDLKQAKEMMLIIVSTDGKVETVGTSYLRQLFEHIESQSRDAELGRAAEKKFQGYLSAANCQGLYKSDKCFLSWSGGCCYWREVCRLRAGKEAECGE